MSTPIYYSIFIGSIFLFLSIAKLYRDAEGISKFFVWLTMTLFSGLRVAVGRDYSIYLDSYSNHLSGHFARLEPFWQSFNVLCNDINMPFHLWQTIVAGFTYYILFKALKSWRIDWGLGILCYLLIYKGFFESMNQIRQCLAISFVLWSSSYLYQKRYLPFILLTVIAGIFHLSAFVCLVMLPIINLPWKRNLLLGFTTFSLFLGMLYFKEIIALISPIVPSSYQVYIDKIETWKPESTTGLYRIFLNIINLGLTFLFYRREGFQDKRLDFLIRMQVFSVCIYNVFFKLDPVMRLMAYPFMGFVLFFPIVIKNFSFNTEKYFAGLSLLGLSFFTIKDVVNINEPYAHYQTIINSTDNTIIIGVEKSDKKTGRSEKQGLKGTQLKAEQEEQE